MRYASILGKAAGLGLSAVVLSSMLMSPAAAQQTAPQPELQKTCDHMKEQRARTARIFAMDQGWHGTGYRIDNNHIITAWHVIEDSQNLKITLVGHKTVDAKVIAQDEKMDLALLEFTPTEDMETVSRAEIGKSKMGQVLCAYSAKQGYKPIVTEELGMDHVKMSQLPDTDSTIARTITPYDFRQGDSGMGVTNTDGKLVALVQQTAFEEVAPSGGWETLVHTSNHLVVSNHLVSFLDEHLPDHSTQRDAGDDYQR